MIATVRAILHSQGFSPAPLLDAVKNYWEFGNQMAVTQEDFVDTCEWMEEETEEECRGLKIPINKKGAEDLAEAAILFHVAGENWTVPDMGWDDTNLGMFAGDMKCAAHCVKLVYDAAERLEAKKIGVTE